MATRKKLTDPRDASPIFGPRRESWRELIAAADPALYPHLTRLPKQAKDAVADQMARSSVYQDETVTHR
jgi:hypothetical protein